MHKQRSISRSIFTCLYLLAENGFQNIIVDVMNQDKTAVVSKNVLLKLLQLLDTENQTVHAL